MKVRAAKRTEIGRLAKVWQDAWRDAHAKIVPVELARLRTVKSFGERLRHALPDVRVIGPVGAPVGFCIVKGDELYQLFVAAPARGSGVAAALIADAEGRLVGSGVEIAWLACAIGNERAARFYEKHGWRRIGTMVSNLETSIGAFPLEVWRYEKDLRQTAPRAESGARTGRRGVVGQGPVAPRAVGISIHTGWAACVVTGGSLTKPEIVASQVIEILGDSERFCFHMAAEMERAAAEKWIAAARKKAIANARRALAPLVTHEVSICAIVAKGGVAADLDVVLASHPRIHTAEGCFYRDVVRDACPIPVQVVPPSSLDPSKVGRLAAPPWGRDQKLAALAAWTVLKG